MKRQSRYFSVLYFVLCGFFLRHEMTEATDEKNEILSQTRETRKISNFIFLLTHCIAKSLH